MQHREKRVASMEQLMPVVLDALENGSSVRILPRGTSMLPMLREGLDSVELSPVTGKLKKHQIPLYRRDNGKYVLHRIVEAGETYTCMGDNQFEPERRLRQDQMIAVVTAFYRGERRYPVSHPAYRLYCLAWAHTRWLRHTFRRGIRWIRRRIG